MTNQSVNGGPAISTQANTQAVMEQPADVATDSLNSTGPNPRVRWIETDAVANAGAWDVSVDNGIMSFRTRTDLDAVGATFIAVTRSATTVTLVACAATAFTFSASGGVSCLLGDLSVGTLTKGLRVAEGTDAKQGLTGAMVAGTLLVANLSVTANSRIFVTRQDGGTNPGAVYVSARVAGASFTVTSTNVADTGAVAFQIFEPA